MNGSWGHAPPANLIDLRGSAVQAHQGWPVRPRPWAKVTGICLHQTACVLGTRPARWNTVGAHLGIMRDGGVPWMHDFDKLVVHGNGWNAATVGIEIDGLYAGVEGDPSTTWDNPVTAPREEGMTLTAATIEAAQEAIRWICWEVAVHGGKVRALVAHRQSSSTRRNDPGSAIWKAIALPMMAELELTDGGPGFRLDDGRPIPWEWDPSRDAKY